jgi:hypothetical protein
MERRASLSSDVRCIWGVNDRDVHTGADEEKGGTERRPVRAREVQH